MYVRPQGPVSRREGTVFVFDLTTLLGDTIPTTRPRKVPFIFSRTQKYSLVFFYYTAGAVTTTRVVFATDNGLVEDPLSPGDPYIYEITGVFDIEKFTYKQSADTLYIAQPGRIPIEFKRLAHDNWDADEIVFTDQPSDWNATDGYPEFVDFYEQRIVYIATQKRPQTAWFSKSGDFVNFGVSSPIVESDAVTLTFDSGTQNEVSWSSSTNRLLIGTMGDEWAISGSGADPLSFKSNRTARHTNNGGERLKSLMVGPVTLFLEYHGRKVNQFIFDYNSDTYDTMDLSVLAPHLTDNNSIVDWDYAQTPHGVIWCVRDDGVLIALTLKREHKVTGWHPHDTDGRFLAVSCIPGDITAREDVVWFVVEREIEGVTKWYIEKKSPEFLGTEASDSLFLDSHLVVTSGTPFSTVTGLEHLEGKLVSILGDGGVLTPRTVVSGEIILENPVSKAVVGLPYASIVEPVLLDLPLADGTYLGRSARITGVDLIVHKSLDFEIGTYRDETDELILQDIPFRFPYHIAGTAIPLFTGVRAVDFIEGYSTSTRVLVKQERPLPLTVIGIIDVVEVYD
jgi:hypothetical protein